MFANIQCSTKGKDHLKGQGNHHFAIFMQKKPHIAHFYAVLLLFYSLPSSEITKLYKKTHLFVAKINSQSTYVTSSLSLQRGRWTNKREISLLLEPVFFILGIELATTIPFAVYIDSAKKREKNR